MITLAHHEPMAQVNEYQMQLNYVLMVMKYFSFYIFLSHGQAIAVLFIASEIYPEKAPNAQKALCSWVSLYKQTSHVVNVSLFEPFQEMFCSCQVILHV